MGTRSFVLWSPRITTMHRHLMLLLVALAALQLVAMAQPATQKTEQKPVPTIFTYEKELGLTADQVQKLKARLVSLQESTSRSRESIKGLEQQYRALLARDDTPLASIEAKLKEIAAIQVASQMEDVKASRDILAVLTPEQIKKWREIQAKARTEQGK